MRRFRQSQQLALGIASACISATTSVRAQQASASGTTVPTIAIVGATAVTMEGARIIRDATLIARNGVIVAIGPRRGTPVPRGALSIDGRGKWIIPGLVDSHVHLTTSDDSANAQLVGVGLAKGVTTVFEMAGSRASLRLRESIRSGVVPGPTLYTAGPVAGDDKMTLETAARFVDEHRAAGYDFIKVYNQLPKEPYRAILRRAQEVGMPVVGHVVRAIDLEGTLGSGQRGIVHMEEYLYTYFNYRNRDTSVAPGARFDSSAVRYLAQRTLASHVWVTPTLVMFESILGQGENMARRLSRPEAQYIPASIFANSWVPDSNPYTQFDNPRYVRNLRAALEFQRYMVREFHKAGVQLLAGTDAPTPAAVPGFSLHEELRNFVAAGLTPYEALATATRNAAAYLDKSREFGTLSVGKRADVVLLEADPLTSIANTERIAGVMASGRWIARERIDSMLARYRRSADR